MRVYKCDICGGIMNSPQVRIKLWSTKLDFCYECWTDFKALRKKEREQKAREEDNA